MAQNFQFRDDVAKGKDECSVGGKRWHRRDVQQQHIPRPCTGNRESTVMSLLVCLFAWCLTALSAYIGYIVP